MWGGIRQIGTVVDAWTRQHWRDGGGSLAGWLLTILLVLLIVTWGATAIGLPRNPADELAPLATQVASPQVKDPNDALDPKDRLALQRDLVEYAADNRVRTWTLLAQVIGAAVLAIGGYFTWRNLRVTQERLDVDRQAQITNRFTQAIGQLGAELNDGQPNLEVRLGGIYALDRIAHDSPRDHWTIMEILTAYVRQNAPWPPHSITSLSPPLWTPRTVSGIDESVEAKPPRTDIQAILTVLGRRLLSHDLPGVQLDLHGTDLQQADFADAHFEGANLWGTHLEEAFLMGVHLEGGNLARAHLAGADLRSAYLEGTNLYLADLAGANLTSADVASARNPTKEQVYSALNHGEGAVLPPDWAADWRARLQKSAEQPPATPPP